MKKFILTLILPILLNHLSFAGEGMWLPLLLKELNEFEMKSMGMRISADDIYNVNNSSLKDAILLFGRGCTAEIVSNEGLIFTNHHCGYSQIQEHSSINHDYLTDGFWAMQKQDELPNPGLTVKLLINMEDVTDKVLNGTNSKMANSEREKIIKSNIEKITKKATENNWYQAIVKPFYEGNEYYMFIFEEFKDVRLVGAPPSSIGKFGGDTDNWMWPRHTGDFSIFRIYVDKDNKPAEYSINNVPYKPKKHLTISLKGVEKDDFTFVFGYPGITNEYLPSFQIENITEFQNPIAIRLRQKRLDIFNAYSKNDDEVRIKYSAKHASVANFWKKMIGESRGIKRTNAIDKKRELEVEFNNWANSSLEQKENFGNLIKSFADINSDFRQQNIDKTYFFEAGLGVEAIRFAYSFNQLAKLTENKTLNKPKIDSLVNKLKESSKQFFKDYYMPIDRSVFAELINDWYDNRTHSQLPENITKQIVKFNLNFNNLANYLYEKSIFCNKDKVEKLLANISTKSHKQITNDPLFKISKELYSNYLTNTYPKLTNLISKNDSLLRIYMNGLMKFENTRRFYPNANSTLRVAYGKVNGFKPADGVEYEYFTTLDGIIEKSNTEIYDYAISDKLLNLYTTKDYGDYADKDGNMRVAFIASNHTTGGNSGSPVLNADGHLVGINFDRNWEGTMSDLMYDPLQCRNISIDIRYCLFTIDKYAGAKHLINEMTILK